MESRELMEIVSRSSKVPLYYQLYQILDEKIRQGAWKPEEMLPTESDLVRQYDLSRATVRQAFDLLVNQDKVYRRRGQGTFVSRLGVEAAPNRIVSIQEDLRQRGIKPGVKVISKKLMLATEEMAARLEIEPNQELATLVRLHLANGQPLGMEHTMLVHSCCPGVLDRNTTRHSLWSVLANRYNLHVVRARQEVQAAPADPEMARTLKVAPGAPLLHINRVYYTSEGVAVACQQLDLRGDRYLLYGELKD
jgi:GntR family transcriptional regulator